MARVRRGGQCDRDLLNDLLNGPAGENFKKELTFALSWFAPMAMEDRIKWLLGNAEHFDLLSKWCPEDDVVEGCFAPLDKSNPNQKFLLSCFFLALDKALYHLGTHALCLEWGLVPSLCVVPWMGACALFVSRALHGLCTS